MVLFSIIAELVFESLLLLLLPLLVVVCCRWAADGW
jgi:hypothetical protein